VRADLVLQRLTSSPVRRRGLARPGASRWLGGLVLGLGLGLEPACAPHKDSECAKVQARVLEELRVVDGFHDHLHDREAMARHAHLLRAVSADLRALNIRDASLRRAVEDYHASIEHLATAWARLADAGVPGPGVGTDASVLVSAPGSLHEVLAAHAAVMNSARSAISEACGAR
jgi:hypothetical protein